MVLLVVLLAWLVFWRSGTRPDAQAAPVVEKAADEVPHRMSAVENQPAEVARRIEPAAEEPAIPSGLDVAARTLGVRSSIGLVLPFIEWWVDEVEWQRVTLIDGHCEIGAMQLPCLVRAPGHVAAMASTAGEELVLEPDALLQLESADLRTCANWIRPSDRYSASDPYNNQAWDETLMRPDYRRAIAWGWVADNRWALAVSTDLLGEATHNEAVQAVVRWRDGRRADLYFAAKPGSRNSWNVVCENTAATADLEVHVVRPDIGEAGPVSLQLWRIVESTSNARTDTKEWGSVVFYSPETYWQSLVARAGAESALFDSVPLGTRLSLGARDEETCARGRLVFVHDGTARTIELRPPFEVTGRAVSSATSSPVTTMDWSWQFREGKEAVRGWHAEARDLVLAPDGSFRLRGPSGAPMKLDVQLDPPAHFMLHLEAPGFEPFEKLFDTGGATSFDCGEVRLVPMHGEIVLAPGHGLGTKYEQWEDLKLSAAPEIWWSVRDAAPMPDGGLEVFLLRSKQQPTRFRVSSGEARAWPETPSERMLIHVLLENDNGDEPWAFDRGADGRYVAAPRRQFDIEVECHALPSEGNSWYLGLEWHGLSDVFAKIPAWKLGQKTLVHFSIPAEGATLYWSATGDPPRSSNEPGGSTPIGTLSGTLVIQ
ncbi:MAG TPA: hypothetical protein VK843_08635 [Planctomycetota bacterium]|nr:hypothetical protein [Planctomycetota bacterium]